MTTEQIKLLCDAQAQALFELLADIRLGDLDLNSQFRIRLARCCKDAYDGFADSLECDSISAEQERQRDAADAAIQKLGDELVAGWGEPVDDEDDEDETVNLGDPLPFNPTDCVEALLPDPPSNSSLLSPGATAELIHQQIKEALNGRR